METEKKSKQTTSPYWEIAKDALRQAEQWQRQANQETSSKEKNQQDKMQALFKNPRDKVTLVSLFDQSFRSSSAQRAIQQILTLFKKQGIPKFFTPIEVCLLKVFLAFGNLVPTFAIRQFRKKIRQETQEMILLGENEALHRHHANRKKQGFQINLNLLGEMVLGEQEAQNHLQQYIQMLADPSIEYISIKISSIYSQLTPLGERHAEQVLVERLSQLYRSAIQHSFAQPDGQLCAKFINLDMEEYRDVALTLDVFMKTLEQPEFKDLKAGIVLQAYLPDAFPWQQQLTEWAQKRTAAGGSPIKLRIVKGANLQMEKVESSLQGWELPVYDSKAEVDANYKRMLEYATLPEHCAAVHLGVASHNLFDLAYAWNLAKYHHSEPFVIFEMLEGIANPVKENFLKNDLPCLIYTPIAGEQQFLHAISYLIRRMDENTAPDNFLRHSFGLKVPSPSWKFLEKQFLASWELKDSVSASRKRTQNRLTEHFASPQFFPFCNFQNEPDTNWYLPENQQWADEIRTKWKKGSQDPPVRIPLKIAGKFVKGGRDWQSFYDRCQDDSVCPFSVELAQVDDLRAILSIAKTDASSWRKTSSEERHRILSAVANQLRNDRGDLIGVMAAVTGKTFPEADAEISEAIDFTEYYPSSLRQLEKDHPQLQFNGKGVGLVIAPWNFPLAIPCGGIVASLASGNTTLLKPAPEAIPVAQALAECFWKGGVPQEALQIIPCQEGKILKELVSSPILDFIIFTGGTETAFKILFACPQTPVFAETGGKNATIVTTVSDRDQAVHNVTRSAFSNAGQKCSASSLLILEKEVYEDPLFRQQLVDCIESYTCGSVWDFSSQVGALIHPPDEKLTQAFDQLEAGESWLIPPQNVNANPHLWKPCVRWGVTSGSFSHHTELFGPHLSVMKADNLKEAVAMVNATGYGLTSGLESLDSEEQEYWKKHVNAGNLYINGSTTGAIVLRQPFGGMGKSAFGPGLKAGGPNYLTSFVTITEKGSPQQKEPLSPDSPMRALLDSLKEALQSLPDADLPPVELADLMEAAESYAAQIEHQFSKEHDFVHLYGQDNLFRYLPAEKVLIRLHRDDSPFEMLSRVLAALLTKCAATVSIDAKITLNLIHFFQENPIFQGKLNMVIENETKFLVRLIEAKRVRFAHPNRVSDAVYQMAAQSGVYLDTTPPLKEGRFELLHTLQEQSICFNYHRYGNLGEREIQ